MSRIHHFFLLSSAEVETDELSKGPAVFCGLGLSLGLIGVFIGTYFFFKAGKSGPTG